MREGSGLVIAGSADQFVPLAKVVFAKRLGPGCPSPARPCPVVLGYMIP